MEYAAFYGLFLGLLFWFSTFIRPSFTNFVKNIKEFLKMLKFLHRHRWYLASANSVRRMLSGTLANANETNLLYRCNKCPQVYVKTIDGQWQNSDFGLSDDK